MRSTLNTNVITGLDMCKACTEAVHWVAHFSFFDKYALQNVGKRGTGARFLTWKV